MVYTHVQRQKSEPITPYFIIIVINHLHLLRHIDRLVNSSITSKARVDSAREGDQVALIRAEFGLAIALGPDGGESLAVGVFHFAEMHCRILFVVVGVGAVGVLSDVVDQDVQGWKTGANQSDATFGISIMS